MALAANPGKPRITASSPRALGGIGSFSMIVRLSCVFVPVDSVSSNAPRPVVSITIDSTWALMSSEISIETGRLDRSSTERASDRNPSRTTCNS